MNYFIIAAILVLDQITKYMVKSRFILNESIAIIDNIFHLTYVRNFGAAFGILKHQKLFFILLTSVVLIGIIIFIRKQSSLHPIVKLSLSLIIGGAVGNLIDRVAYGYVIDFFDFRIWPVFNIADMAIVIGACLLSYFLIFVEPSL
ncbi:signal peptidase II . Aspartic peptidase. MEROPS family A08 [Geosporobacter subterraneus DSM 17957]|uniref:Lipoprotein signal peptidase n=1 Tax=Geosporobacter subterraneus DSM 17957 TaxID=1121919 RepID=A0A1M6GSZ0_9FIRM|nr:signal peptidase II [Geosporobacter subterraneus]SHJ13041.1 signal peptidase II . Aspartic peptidase. MEROPS family A08 [Geosporobacter subterraneus DSM 17957]